MRRNVTLDNGSCDTTIPF